MHTNKSEKTISVIEAQRHFGNMLQDVAIKGDKFVVERNGEPIAVIVPVQLYEQWKRWKEAFFERIRTAAKLDFIHVIDKKGRAGYAGSTPHLPERVCHAEPAFGDYTGPAPV